MQVIKLTIWSVRNQLRINMSKNQGDCFVEEW
jgi:hypothetical protein